MCQLKPVVAQQPGHHLVDLQEREVAADAQMAATAKLQTDAMSEQERGE